SLVRSQLSAVVEQPVNSAIDKSRPGRKTVLIWSRLSGATRPEAVVFCVSRGAARPQEPLVMRLDGGVTFAGRMAQPFQSGDLDMAAAIVDEIRLLEHAGHQRDAVAPGAYHLRHRFLCQDKLVLAGEIMCLQQISGQSGLNGVGGVAADRLLDLRIDGQS